MRKEKIETSKIRLAQMRYFDAKRNGSEIPVEKAYAFLVNVNGNYINIFNPLEEIPVYDRVNYSNTLSNGEVYGTKIELVSGEVKDGLCYIMEKINGTDLFDKDIISVGELEDYMLNSDYYFIDRLEIMKNKNWPNRKLHGLDKKIQEDMLKFERINEEFHNQMQSCQYHK